MIKGVKITTVLIITILGYIVDLSGSEKSTNQPVKVACVGNSITFGYRIKDRANNAYPQQLQNMLGDQYEVRNFGSSGKTLLHNGDHPYINTKQYKNALSFAPDIVLILLGTNDSKKQNRDKLADHFINDYKELIDSFKKQNSDVRVVTMLPLPSFKEDSVKIWNPVIVEDIIPRIKDIAYQEQLEVLDLYHPFVDKNNDKYMPDKIHPTAAGASIIAERVYETVILKEEEQALDLNKNSDLKLFNFCGFQGYSFDYKGLSLKIVEPKISLKGKPWIWRARFWGHQPQTDAAMLERGFHIVYCEVGTLFGSAEAVDRWDICYDYVTDLGLSKKVVIEAMSRGGLIAYNWAKENRRKVAAIYADAPVLDGRSWPGGFESGKGSASDWKLLKQHYNIVSDLESESFEGWPIDYAAKFAKWGIPLLHVCGESDKVVPVGENTKLFEEQILDLGGDITTIYKPGVGHHPHSLQNPTPIVDFILRATNYKLKIVAE